MTPISMPSSMNGIGTNSPARKTTMAMTKAWLIMLPKRRIISEKERVTSDRRLSGKQHRVGLHDSARHRRAKPRSLDAVGMHREEDDQRQRRRRLKMRGRRLDARQHGGEVGGDDEDEERAEERHVGPGIGLHHLRATWSAIVSTTISSGLCSGPPSTFGAAHAEP